MAKFQKIARGLVRERGKMNKMESEYSFVLELRKKAGEILWWDFESIRLNVGSGAWYTPDFLIMIADGTLEIHEVKGHKRRAGMVRFKAAASKFPFRFYLVERDGKHGWKETLYE